VYETTSETAYTHVVATDHEIDAVAAALRVRSICLD
jgi:hypothetical protein